MNRFVSFLVMKINLPGKEYCRNIHKGFCLPSRVSDHCEKVAGVGYIIGNMLIERIVAINPDMIHRLGLVHDAFKTATLSLRDLKNHPEGISFNELVGWLPLRMLHKGDHETEVAARELKRDFSEFARIVRQIGSSKNPSYLDARSEVRVHHYADWRVQGVEVVPFSERLKYLKDKYFNGSEAEGQERLEKEKQLEAELFKYLNFEPEDLALLL